MQACLVSHLIFSLLARCASEQMSAKHAVAPVDSDNTAWKGQQSVLVLLSLLVIFVQQTVCKEARGILLRMLNPSHGKMTWGLLLIDQYCHSQHCIGPNRIH